MRLSKFFLLFLLIFLSCQVEDASVSLIDAYSELNQAIEYKSKECGNKPENILIPPNNVKRESLKICTLSILRMECPFLEYPIFCYDMFLEFFPK